jgi:hypothetical protein
MFFAGPSNSTYAFGPLYFHIMTFRFVFSNKITAVLPTSSQTQSDINQAISLTTIEQATKRFNPPTVVTVRAKQMTGDCSNRPLHSSDGCCCYDDEDRRSSSSAEEDLIIVLETSAATITASTTNTQHWKHSCVTRSFLHAFSSFQPHALAFGFLVKIVAIVAAWCP